MNIFGYLGLRLRSSWMWTQTRIHSRTLHGPEEPISESEFFCWSKILDPTNFWGPIFISSIYIPFLSNLV